MLRPCAPPRRPSVFTRCRGAGARLDRPGPDSGRRAVGPAGRVRAAGCSRHPAATPNGSGRSRRRPPSTMRCVSHRSALLLHGLPVVGARPALPEITVRAARHGRSADATHLHRAALPDAHVVTVSTACRSTSDRAHPGRRRARHRPTHDGGRRDRRGAASRARRRRRSSTTSCLRCWNWPRIRRAQRALCGWPTPGPSRRSNRSAGSSMRLAAVAGAGPAGVASSTAGGRVVGRLDFYWDEFGVAGEADGRAQVRRPRRADRREGPAGATSRTSGSSSSGGAGDARDVRRSRAAGRGSSDAFERGRARDRSGFPRVWSVRGVTEPT